MGTKKTTSKKKTATRGRGRRNKPATSRSLFKAGTGSNAEREARDWQDILGAETKAALDAKIGQTITGGMLSPVEALYWHSLLQERLRACPTHLLRAVARSIRDSGAVLQEVVDEVNVRRARHKRQSSSGGTATQRKAADTRKWGSSADYAEIYVEALRKHGGPRKHGAKRLACQAVLRAQIKKGRRISATDKNALDGIARYFRKHFRTHRLPE